MGSFTLFSHDWPDRSTPTASDRAQGAAFLDVRRRDPPGGWSDNRLAQVQHDRSAIYIAVRRVMGLVSGAHVAVLQKKKKVTVKKSAGSGPQRHGRDEDYTPLDDHDHPLCRLL
jgi:hypothetical protein